MSELGTLFGGRALEMMDIVASIAAMRLARKPVVTASIDRTDFNLPVYVGEIAEVTGRIVGVGRTSIAVQVELWAENIHSGERRLATVARFALVAVGNDGKPTAVHHS